MLAIILTSAVSWSGFFIVPVAMTVDRDRIVFVRKTPFGTVNADWIFEATGLNGEECRAAGSSIYQPKKDNMAIIPTPPSLIPCLQETAVVETSRTVRIFGVPLRPVRLTTIVEAIK